MLKRLGGYAAGAAGYVLGAAILVALLAIPVLFIKGAVWASDHLLEPLITIAWWVLGLTVVALPLAMFRRLRGIVGITIFFSSYVYGLLAWLTGFVITYTYWGVFGVLIGLIFGGIGVVPVGLLASAFHGWNGFVPLLILVVLTLGARVGGFALIRSSDR